MYPLYFSAALKSEDGRLLEIGEACLSETENAIEFNSEFVPLLQLGSTAQIVRVLGNQEFDYFIGKVYLSTQKMLKLIDIPEKVMENAHRLFDVNENLSITLALAPGKSPHFNTQKAAHMAGNVRYLSNDVVKLVAMEFIAEGQILSFSIDSPTIKLDELCVTVRERVLLKRNAAVLICDVLPPSAGNRSSLSAFFSKFMPAPKLL